MVMAQAKSGVAVVEMSAFSWKHFTTSLGIRQFRLGWAIAVSCAIHGIAAVAFLATHEIHFSGMRQDSGSLFTVSLVPFDQVKKFSVSKKTFITEARIAPAIETKLGNAPLIDAARSQQNEKISAPDIDLIFPAASQYRRTSGLDSAPTPIGEIQPEYPPEASEQAGTVTIRLFINDQGQVDKVIVMRASIPGLFDDSAVRAFGAARFVPGKFLGIPVKSQMTIEVEFSRINRGTSVSGR